MAKEFRIQENMKKMEEKIQRQRLNWFEKNYKKVYENPSLPPDKIPKNASDLYDELINSRKEMMEMERKLNAERKENIEREKQDKIASIKYKKEITPDLLSDMNVMYPVPKILLDILYRGTSHNSEGRWLYLKLRNNLHPWKKYLNLITSTQAYGWKIDDGRASEPMKQFCRRTIIEGSFYRRYGVKADSPLKMLPFSAGQVTVERL